MSDELRRCSGCQRQLPAGSFPQRGSRCLDCRRATIRSHYTANRAYYIQKARRRRQRVVQETRNWLTEYLDEHPCVDCGNRDIRVLEFDHRDRMTKVLAVAVLARGGYGLDRVKAEVAKCVVRCANCHRIRTHQQRGWWGAGVPATERARQDSNLQPPDP
jgi:hypothetical protein